MGNNRVTHFEIPCNDPEATIKFFQEVFDWKFQAFGQDDYWIALSGDTGTPGINGAIMRKKDPNQPIVNTIQVDHIEKAIRKIEKSGGAIVVPKMPVSGVGWMAYFKDPDGNVHGVWEEDKFAK